MDTTTPTESIDQIDGRLAPSTMVLVVYESAVCDCGQPVLVHPRAAQADEVICPGCAWVAREHGGATWAGQGGDLIGGGRIRYPSGRIAQVGVRSRA